MRVKGKSKSLKVLGLCLVILAVIVVVVYYAWGPQRHGDELTFEHAYSLGDIITIEGVKVNIVRSYESKGTDSERPRHQSIFTIARISIANEGNQAIEIKPEDFILVVDGEQLPYRRLNYVFDPLRPTNLDPGAVIEGAVSWENPTKYRSKYVLFDTLFGKEVAVNLIKED